jgi:two-component system, OmpR family, phosphate regulon response regulator OmpR
MSKPFSPRELLARIKAVLRRSTVDAAAPTAEAKHQKISAGGISIDPQSMMMESGAKKIELSKTEFRILETLLRNPNIVLSRDAIMNSARGRDFMAFERSIDVHVSKLRSKVEEISGDKNKIRTVWGTGYMFVV